MRSKIDINFEAQFLQNGALAVAGAKILRIWGSKLGAKIDQKSIKKCNPRWNALGYRFFDDFHGFWDLTWDAKPTQIGLTWPSWDRKSERGAS